MTGRRLSEPSFAFLLNAPALLAIILLGYPIVYSAWLSLHRYNLKRPALFRFIGVENYLAISAPRSSGRYVVTAGGPGTATTTLVWQTYLTTFDSLDFGLGNAYA